MEKVPFEFPAIKGKTERTKQALKADAVMSKKCFLSEVCVCEQSQFATVRLTTQMCDSACDLSPLLQGTQTHFSLWAT